LNNLYISYGFSACAKQISCHDFKPLKQVFVVRTKNPEFRHFVHENEPPSVELGLLDPQGVSVKFYHGTHPHRSFSILLEHSVSSCRVLWGGSAVYPLVRSLRALRRGIDIFVFQTNELNSNGRLRQLEAENKEFS